jgi:hypothetical protein
VDFPIYVLVAVSVWALASVVIIKVQKAQGYLVDSYETEEWQFVVVLGSVFWPVGVFGLVFLGGFFGFPWLSSKAWNYFWERL